MLAADSGANGSICSQIGADRDRTGRSGWEADNPLKRTKWREKIIRRPGLVSRSPDRDYSSVTHELQEVIQIVSDMPVIRPGRCVHRDTAVFAARIVRVGGRR